MNEEENMLKTRAEDLELLLGFRKNTIDKMNTKDKIDFIFIYINTICYLPVNEALDKLEKVYNKIKLNRPSYYLQSKKRLQYFCHLYEVKNICKFKYKNSTIIQMLNITEEEQRQLTLIVSEKILEERYEKKFGFSDV